MLDIIVADNIHLTYCVQQVRQIVVRCFISTPPQLQHILLRTICLSIINLVSEFLLNFIDNGLRLISRILHNCG
jgi:hypothetical protein